MTSSAASVDAAIGQSAPADDPRADAGSVPSGGARIKARAVRVLGRLTERGRAFRLGQLRASREAVLEKLRVVPDRMQKLVNQVRLLLDLVDDYGAGRYRAVSPLALGFAALAALFFLSPTDVVPDWIPVVGQLDDVAVIAIALKVLKRDLIKYCQFRGLDPAEYF